MNNELIIISMAESILKDKYSSNSEWDLIQVTMHNVCWYNTLRMVTRSQFMLVTFGQLFFSSGTGAIRILIYSLIGFHNYLDTIC